MKKCKLSEISLAYQMRSFINLGDIFNCHGYNSELFKDRAGKAMDDYAKDGGPEVYVVFTKILCSLNFCV